MECIKSAARSALVAFAPDAPYLAAGTMAGAVDLSFSSSANLEIFELDFKSDARDLPLVGTCPSSERFNRLSWSKPLPASEEYGLGLVAGGCGDGSIGVWNPIKLTGSEDQNDAFVVKLEKHTGPVRGLEFNVLAPNLLASGADEGELCIWDLAKPVEPNLFPSLKSTGSGARTEVSFVSWNPKFQHILASTSYSGMTVVWDLKQQKPVTSFSDSTRRSCSVVQWNPDISTQLIVASDDDSSPSLRVWDVRKTISPLRELVGHTKGVIAMSWCPHDSSFLLTCSKDNRTICWDTAGEIVCELPASSNMNFDVHWYPRIPGVISACSFDVKIGIYNIQAYNRFSVGEGVFSSPVHLRAPKWLKRPVGASFGFGGKLVSYQPSSSAPSSSSEVYVHKLVTEQSLVSRSSEFEAAIQDGEKTSLRFLCEKKSQESLSEDEKEIWGFMKVMFEEEGTARTKLLNHLGFSVPNGGTEDETDEVGKKLANSISFDEKAIKSAFFAGEEGNAFLIDNGDVFFNNILPPDDNFVVEDGEVSSDNQIKKEPEEHRESTDSSVDDRIQRALVVGDYKGAVLLCITAKRMADALVISHVGGPALWEITCDQYLKNSVSPYLKVVSAMVTNNLVSLVNSRPLDSWKETLALFCTFAQKEEWTILCDTLASKLMSVGNTLAATLCYICAGNIDKTVEILSHSLKTECEGKTFVDLLQDLMEKTIVLALATGQKRFSASLSKLVENYAELLASQGLLTTSMEYLKLLGSEESSHELAILRARIAVSVAEREAPPTAADYVPQQLDLMHGTEKPSYGAIDGSQSYYQPQPQPQPQPQANIPGGSYGNGYQYGYQPSSQSVELKPLYSNPATFQPSQPAFIPSHPHSYPVQSNIPAAAVQAQPVVRPFTPATPLVIKNVDQYQQPSVGSHLYPGGINHTHPSGPPGLARGAGVAQPGHVPGQMFPHSFSPQQPSSPTQPPQAQPVAAPPAPPPTVPTVDTSNVPAELKLVITTLTRLFNETSQALGGPHANTAKKREIEDNSRKIGALFAKLNSGDISPNAAAKLSQLCQALDVGDFPRALHIQVVLTTSDWDECNFWLAALKRMIKTRQSVRI